MAPSNRLLAVQEVRYIDYCTWRRALGGSMTNPGGQTWNYLTPGETTVMLRPLKGVLRFIESSTRHHNFVICWRTCNAEVICDGTLRRNHDPDLISDRRIDIFLRGL